MDTLLLVKKDAEGTIIIDREKSNLTLEDAFYITTMLLGVISDTSGIDYNEVVDNFKSIKEEGENE